MDAKYFSLILHSHIPYVLAHGSWPQGMDWLFEAAAESSDWPFLISTWTARDYSENRVAEHYERARTLVEWIQRNGPLSPAEKRLLETLEEEDNLFSEIVIPDGRIV